MDTQLIGKLVVILPLFTVFVLFLEFLIARYSPVDEFINPERKIRVFESQGEKLKYVVMGDSTAAGQGADYEKGIAIKSAEHLRAKYNYNVEMLNLGISGADFNEVVSNQLQEALAFKPDVVLISATANDVTSVNSPNHVVAKLTEVVESLVANNCNIKIVYTGSPDMGTAIRIMRPLRDLLGYYSSYMNSTVLPAAENLNLTLAPIAASTGPTFKNDPTLFASDGFHPNERGYAAWTEVINTALDQALSSQQSHCK